MDFYVLERLNADHRAELMGEMQRIAAGRQAGGGLGIAVARALRGVADRLDGGPGPKPKKRPGTLRVLE